MAINRRVERDAREAEKKFVLNSRSIESGYESEVRRRRTFQPPAEGVGVRRGKQFVDRPVRCGAAGCVELWIYAAAR